MEIRQYQSGDETKIESLFKDAFGKLMPEGFWNWRYRNNPFTNNIMIHMMWDGDTLAGHYAVSPVEMIVNGDKILTALSMTTMTHPSYGGKGIFSQLAGSLYNEIFEKSNVKAVWGFPNVNSHYGFIKNLKWNDLTYIPLLSLKVDGVKLRKVEYSVSREFTPQKVQALNSSNAVVRINKTLEYLNWRYVLNPVFYYDIIELDQDPSTFAVIKILNSFLDPSQYEVDVLELNVMNDETCSDLMVAIINYANQKGKSIQQINMWKSLFSKRHIMFEKLRFTLIPPITFMGVLTLDNSRSVMQDFRNWEVTMGYSDVF